MKDKIDRRFRELVDQGVQLLHAVGRDEHGPKYWVPGEALSQYQGWISSAVNLIDVVSPATGHFRKAVEDALATPELRAGIPTSVFQKVQGVLNAAYAEWQAGLLRTVEYIVAAATFDDFLDHATLYHSSGKKVEAAVLGSAVFEDALRKLANKHGLEAAGRSIESVIDDLQKAGVLTPVKAKRMKASAGVRNSALHAQWDALDIRDVGEQITTARELIDHYL